MTASDYQNALVSVNTADEEGNVSVTGSITTAIDSLASSGATRTSYGMEMANQVFANNSIEGTERQRIVVVFTDGKPGFSSYESDEANRAVKEAYDTKQTYGAKVYTIGLYSQTNNNDVNNFMNYLSSNYPEAQGTSDNSWSNNYHGQPVSERVNENIIRPPMMFLNWRIFSQIFPRIFSILPQRLLWMPMR